MLCHINLPVYYQLIFALAQHHHYSISELEDLMPYERDIYFNMLIEFIETQKEKQRNG